jgi:hypothetical protein
MSHRVLVSDTLELDWGLIDVRHRAAQKRRRDALAAAITQAASKQTYYTIRLLVDRVRVADAYRAYAYFRWLDDRLDQDLVSDPERLAFVEGQQALVGRIYQGEAVGSLAPEEALLLDLIASDPEPDSGLRLYIENLMAIMAFDAGRRGRLISQRELDAYTGWLAAGVTEALHYFIGHDDESPQNEARYLAVSAAHITHMLRDTYEDIAAGYFNIPCEYLDAQGIEPSEVTSAPYRAWVRDRVQLARAYFRAGADYLAQVQNRRCRIAGFAYMARFQTILAAIEREHYRLRPAYPERKSLGAALRMGWSALRGLS